MTTSIDLINGISKLQIQQLKENAMKSKPKKQRKPELNLEAVKVLEKHKSMAQKKIERLKDRINFIDELIDKAVEAVEAVEEWEDEEEELVGRTFRVLKKFEYHLSPEAMETTLEVGSEWGVIESSGKMIRIKNDEGRELLLFPEYLDDTETFEELSELSEIV